MTISELSAIHAVALIHDGRIQRFVVQLDLTWLLVIERTIMRYLNATDLMARWSRRCPKLIMWIKVNRLAFFLAHVHWNLGQRSEILPRLPFSCGSIMVLGRVLANERMNLLVLNKSAIHWWSSSRSSGNIGIFLWR